MPDSSRPFAVRRESAAAVVAFAVYVDHSRSSTDDTELDGLLATGDLVCDLTQTRSMTSDWIRLLVKLTLGGEKRGRRVRLAGVQGSVLETADLIAAKKHLRLFPTVREALAP